MTNTSKLSKSHLVKLSLPKIYQMLERYTSKFADNLNDKSLKQQDRDKWNKIIAQSGVLLKDIKKYCRLDMLSTTSKANHKIKKYRKKTINFIIVRLSTLIKIMTALQLTIQVINREEKDCYDKDAQDSKT